MCWIDQEDKEPAMPCGGCKELICYDCQCDLDKDVCLKYFCTKDDHGDWDYKSEDFYEGYGDPFYKGNDPNHHAVSKWHLNHRRMTSFCVSNHAPECVIQKMLSGVAQHLAVQSITTKMYGEFTLKWLEDLWYCTNAPYGRQTRIRTLNHQNGSLFSTSCETCFKHRRCIQLGSFCTSSVRRS